MPGELLSLKITADEISPQSVPNSFDLRVYESYKRLAKATPTF
ncbi:MAG: hypothetical protein ABSF29_02755 [Tepidisphaeraceae bacterium]